MSNPDRTWLLRIELPAGLPNPPRFVARLLKHLWRCWRVRCVAVLDVPAVPVVGSKDKDSGE
jgi:hypothetical protein